jgi:hypothetical protein
MTLANDVHYAMKLTFTLPEQVQDLVLYLALLHPGRQFHSSIRDLRLFTIIVAF